LSEIHSRDLREEIERKSQKKTLIGKIKKEKQRWERDFTDYGDLNNRMGNAEIGTHKIRITATRPKLYLIENYNR